MKVLVNGRDLAERTELLGEREEHFFEVVNSAVYFIVGAYVIICLPDVLHFVAGLPFDIGTDSVINAFKILR